LVFLSVEYALNTESAQYSAGLFRISLFFLNIEHQKKKNEKLYQILSFFGTVTKMPMRQYELSEIKWATDDENHNIGLPKTVFVTATGRTAAYKQVEHIYGWSIQFAVIQLL